MMTKKTLSIVTALTALATAGWAQTPPPPAHHGILGRIFHRPAPSSTGRPGFPGMRVPGRLNPISGGIVGNKRTHVYHLPGDRGALPAAQNRVYFHTEGQAMAAGYHRAGASHGRPALGMHSHH